MKLLLDTNVFIWASREPNLLSASAKRALTDPYNQRYVSIASCWEIQIRHGLGKLQLSGNVDQVCKAWLLPLAAETLSIELRHVGKLYDLPHAHRDPFDRVLIAQALSEGMTVVTADPTFTSYKVPVIW